MSYESIDERLERQGQNFGGVEQIPTANLVNILITHIGEMEQYYATLDDVFEELDEREITDLAYRNKQLQHRVERLETALLGVYDSLGDVDTIDRDLQEICHDIKRKRRRQDDRQDTLDEDQA